MLGSMTYALRLALSIYPGCRLYAIGKKETTSTSEKWIFGIEITINILITIGLGVCV